MTGTGCGTVAFDRWQQSGSVWLWRYSERDRNYPGWHLTADRAGASSLIELLDILVNGKQFAFRTVQLVRPTPAILPVPNKRNAEWTAPSKLRIGFARDPNEWIFTCADATAQLTFGLDWYPMLRQAVSGIPLGKGDFSIGPLESKASARAQSPARLHVPATGPATARLHELRAQLYLRRHLLERAPVWDFPIMYSADNSLRLH